MSQFLFQTPAGYLYDYSDSKIIWLSTAGIVTTLCTGITAILAQPKGQNIKFMIVIKFIQGAVTSFIPPGLNSITQGIVGAFGMTQQVAINEMMNHLGSAIIVLVGSLLGFLLYPNLDALFIVSPIACSFFLFFLNRINPHDIDHNEARGLVKDDNDKGDKQQQQQQQQQQKDVYVHPDDDAVMVSGGGGGGGDNTSSTNDATTSPTWNKKTITEKPSFKLRWNMILPTTRKKNDKKASGGSTGGNEPEIQADSPLRVLRDPTLLIFLLIVFLFHMANGMFLF